MRKYKDYLKYEKKIQDKEINDEKEREEKLLKFKKHKTTIFIFITLFVVGIAISGYFIITELVLKSKYYEKIETGYKFLKEKKYEVSETIFKNLKASYPDMVDAYLGLGEVYYLQNKFNPAIENLELAIQSDEKLKEKKFREIPKTIDEILTLSYASYAEQLAKRGEYKRALEEYNKILKKDKSREKEIKSKIFDTAVGAGDKCLTETQFETAVNFYNYALEIDQSRKKEINERIAMTSAFQGDYNLSRNDFDVAEKYYQEAIKKDPTNSVWYYKLASLYETMGKYEQAEIRFKDCINFDPEKDIYHFEIGKLYFKVKKFNEAKKEFETAIEKSKQNEIPEYYYWLGRTLDAMGNKTEGRKYVEKASNLEPENKEYKDFLSGLI